MNINETTAMASTGSYWHVKVGDTVTREFYGHLQELVVVSVEERIIHAADPNHANCIWDFDRSTGFEEDPELGMGVSFGVTCSRLVKSSFDPNLIVE